jgi:RND family efflux transporter MFP subunit
MAQKKALTAGKGQVADTKSKGSIKAPISGVIADKSVEAGDMASPVMPLCRILGVSKLLAILDLAEQDVPRVHVGQEVILQMDAWPDSTFKGVVARILPYLDASTRTNAVEVLVDNPIDPATQKRFLKPGMYGTAQLVVEKRIGVVVVPGYGLLMDTELLDQQQGSELIRKAFVVDKSSVAHERIVKLGIRQGTLWEIVSGLEAGDLLVIRGQHGLVDGQKVEVVD